jgi:hypothetical protein
MNRFVDRLALPLLKVAAQLPGVILEVTRTLQRSLGDGKITADEAEAAARDASRAAGDLLDVKVKGVDVVDAEAQELLFGFVGRIAANATRVLSA